MGDVLKVQTTRCMGLGKEDFRAVYFSFLPDKTDRDFDTAWAQYEDDKAAHLRRLNDQTRSEP